MHWRLHPQSMKCTSRVPREGPPGPPTTYGVCGSAVSSPSRVQSGAPASEGFLHSCHSRQPISYWHTKLLLAVSEPPVSEVWALVICYISTSSCYEIVWWVLINADNNSPPPLSLLQFHSSCHIYAKLRIASWDSWCNSCHRLLPLLSPWEDANASGYCISADHCSSVLCIPASTHCTHDIFTTRECRKKTLTANQLESGFGLVTELCRDMCQLKRHTHETSRAVKRARNTDTDDRI